MNYINYMFSYRLKDLRQRAEMSQKELAEILCVTQGIISAYERGAKMPTYEIMWGIADVFNVSIEYLIGRIDTKEPCTSYDKLLGNSIDRLQSKLWGGQLEAIGVKVSFSTHEMIISINEYIDERIKMLEDKGTSSSEGDTTED